MDVYFSCELSKAKPVKNIQDILGRPYLRMKIRAANNSNSTSYMVEAFTEKQAFHEQKTEAELNTFIEKHAGITFKNCVIRTESEEITILGNKKGETTRLVKKLSAAQKTAKQNIMWNKQKNYLLAEGTPVPFLVLLGVMTPEGRVVNSKYDKFRQINRFLEFINDILPQVQPEDKSVPIRIADFGCGKCYGCRLEAGGIQAFTGGKLYGNLQRNQLSQGSAFRGVAEEAA